MVLSLALWASLLGVPAPPAEDPLPARIELRWNAPPGCSSAEAIHRRVEALLSGPPRGDGEALVVADVTAVAGGVAMTLTTTFAGATDVREVSSASCETLAEATAVLLAVSLEPGLEEEDEEAAPAVPDPPPEPEPEPPPAVHDTPPTPAPLPAAAVEQPSLPPPPRRVRRTGPAVDGLVAAGAEWGAVRDPAGAARLGLGLRGRVHPWAAELVGTYVMPRRHPEGLHQLGAVGLLGCWTPGRAGWQVLVCGGGELGVLRVGSRGLTPKQVVTGPSQGPLAALGGLWQRGRVGLFLRAEAVALLRRSRTTTPEGQERTAQRPMSLRLLLGARFDFTPLRRGRTEVF